MLEAMIRLSGHASETSDFLVSKYIGHAILTMAGQRLTKLIAEHPDGGQLLVHTRIRDRPLGNQGNDAGFRHGAKLWILEHRPVVPRERSTCSTPKSH